MTDFTFPTGNKGSAPTPSRSSNLLLADDTNGGSPITTLYARYGSAWHAVTA